MCGKYGAAKAWNPSLDSFVDCASGKLPFRDVCSSEMNSWFSSVGWMDMRVVDRSRYGLMFVNMTSVNVYLGSVGPQLALHLPRRILLLLGGFLFPGECYPKPPHVRCASPHFGAADPISRRH